MESEIVNIKIHEAFQIQWMQSYVPYDTLIKRLDIGLVYMNNRNQPHLYKIVDYKKWVLAKLKYGL